MSWNPILTKLWKLALWFMSTYQLKKDYWKTSDYNLEALQLFCNFNINYLLPFKNCRSMQLRFQIYGMIRAFCTWSYYIIVVGEYTHLTNICTTFTNFQCTCATLCSSWFKISTIFISCRSTSCSNLKKIIWFYLDLYII